MQLVELEQRLAVAAPGSAESARLAQDLVEYACYPARLALERYFPSADIAALRKAQNVLADMGELSLAQLSATARVENLDNELWMIRTITEEFMDFRRRSAQVLKDLLANRRFAAEVPEGSEFQTPRGARVCDLAFLFLHRLLHLESSSMAYLNLTPGERDERIREFQTSRVFRSALENEL